MPFGIDWSYLNDILGSSMTGSYHSSNRTSFLEKVEVRQSEPHLQLEDFTNKIFRCPPGDNQTHGIVPFGMDQNADSINTQTGKGLHPSLIFDEHWVQQEKARIYKMFPEAVDADVRVHLADVTRSVGRVLWSAIYPLRANILREDDPLSGPDFGQPTFETFCTKVKNSRFPPQSRFYQLTLHTRPRFQADQDLIDENKKSSKKGSTSSGGINEYPFTLLGPQPAGQALFHLNPDHDVYAKPTKHLVGDKNSILSDGEDLEDIENDAVPDREFDPTADMWSEEAVELENQGKLE